METVAAWKGEHSAISTAHCSRKLCCEIMPQRLQTASQQSFVSKIQLQCTTCPTPCRTRWCVGMLHEPSPVHPKHTRELHICTMHYAQCTHVQTTPSQPGGYAAMLRASCRCWDSLAPHNPAGCLPGPCPGTRHQRRTRQSQPRAPHQETCPAAAAVHNPSPTPARFWTATHCSTGQQVHQHRQGTGGDTC